jgi:phospholipase/carboxylesterase
MATPRSLSDIEWLPEDGPIEQLFILLHEQGATPASMTALAVALRAAFPQAAVIAFAGPEPFDRDGTGRQWYGTTGLTEKNQPDRVAGAMPALVARVRATQERLHLLQTNTAIAGFSQGATMALESTLEHDGLAGRILSFSGRYAELPRHAPEWATIHLLHGQVDAVTPVEHALAAHDKLALLHGDATLDIASNVGHQLHPALIAQAIVRLQTCVPLRSWEAALGLNQAPPAGVTLH